ncbi:Flp pilus assembly protein CpaB [Pseudidiomarina planktonica]|uniref:Flp pilus assembly protein CpaB n=2 Tax=Pseudidiomarina planktonica TaxID=1323738 RepID=A0A1Y6EN55_9GAMM|nr:Flp pilus assembly protein CpaB [Pseudidiomarina planktonica]SMQ64095.1 Flp pilus assembly protein CpaB [Pseudidiomarina planktonica]
MKMRQRVLLWLVASSFCTALTYVAIDRYLAQQSQLWQEQNAEPTGAYLVFNHDMPEGKAISAEDLSLRDFPLRIAQPDWLTENDAVRIIGSLLRITVTRGAPLTTTYLKHTETSLLRATLAAGERAVTTRVNHEQVLAGMLEPGDIVDIVVPSEFEGKNHNSFLSHIEVLALDRIMATNDAVENNFFETLTLRLSVAEAERFERIRQLPFSIWLHPANTDEIGISQRYRALPNLHRMGGG